MEVIASEAMEFAPVVAEGARGCKIRELITDRDGAPNFAMRQFEIDAGGQTPLHSHAWEHEVFILEGSGHLRTANGDRPFASGDAIYVAPNELHSFVNSSEARIRMICMVPVEKVCCR